MSEEPVEGHDTRRNYLPWVIGITAANLGLWLMDQWVDATPAAAVVSVASAIALLIAANPVCQGGVRHLRYPII